MSLISSRRQFEDWHLLIQSDLVLEELFELLGLCDHFKIDNLAVPLIKMEMYGTLPDVHVRNRISSKRFAENYSA